ncbi:MAG TPA: hypothetical protein VLG28_13800 [Acidimicrobiia bacterium]|jgi:hypothetical protein|nr:hypothetical protein [Acidimicrobiia bacterium]
MMSRGSVLATTPSSDRYLAATSSIDGLGFHRMTIAPRRECSGYVSDPAGNRWELAIGSDGIALEPTHSDHQIPSTSKHTTE